MALEIGGQQLTGVINTAQTVAKVILISLIFSFIGFIAVWVSQHKIKLHIYELTATKTLKLNIYKARLSKSKGLSMIKPLNPLNKWISMYIKPPNQPHTWFDDGRNTNLMLYKVGNDTYQYVRFNIKDGQAQFSVVDEDMKTWVVNQFKATELKYTKQTFLDKYGNLLGYTMLGMFYLIGLILMLNK